MPSFIRHPKDFWTGVIFLSFGLAAVIIGWDYSMGTAGRMGPAFFPVMLGSLLALIGLVAVVRSFMREGEPVGKIHIKELVLILAAVLLFGYLMRGAGLAPAVIVIVMLSAFASSKFKLSHAPILAVALAAFTYVLFIRLLGLPMPVIGPWLSF